MTGILPDPMTQEQREAYNEARRAVESMGMPVTYVDALALDIAWRRFLDATEPLRKMQARVIALDLDARVMLVLKDGLLERQDTEPSPQAKAALAALDELIASEARRFGIVHGKVHPTPHNPP